MGGILLWHPDLFRRAQTALREPGGVAARLLRLSWRIITVATAVAVLSWGVLYEARFAVLETLLLPRWARTMSFAPEPGPSPDIYFPRHGPYDRRLGYASLPDFTSALLAHGYMIGRQAALSPDLARLMRYGGYPPYQEKDQAGLALYDRYGTGLHAVRQPGAIYQSFEEIPPLVVNTLLFIEDRHLLDAKDVHRDPAVEWQRFLFAGVKRIAGTIDSHMSTGGASTLATQIEKFRHSPQGRTDSITEKLRQMLSAALWAYKDGPDTLEARKRIIVTYLNATTLASRPGFGEIIGIGDALTAWFGTDLAEANRILKDSAETPETLTHKAEVYRQVLSLLLAERRPTYYLLRNHRALGQLTDNYINMLAKAHVIDAKLRDAAHRANLYVLPEAPQLPCCSGDKATDALRTELIDMLNVPSWYDLDRLDLTGYATIDQPTQKRVSNVLAQLNSPEFVEAHNLVGRHLLHTTHNLNVNYSVVVYERSEDGNYLRVHADSLNEPFDINSGAKLILGSTAKLRTLVTYLNIITLLHERYASTPKAELLTQARGRDPLTAWAMTWLATVPDRDLRKMLDAAMQRHHSASPGDFFTNGGMHPFHNFESWEDTIEPTIKYAFEHSINLTFVRLMRDIREYFIAQNQDAARIMADPHDEVREAYLHRFADEDGRKYTRRYYDEYHALKPDAIYALMAHHGRPGLDRRVALFRSVRPDGSVADLRAFLARVPSLHPDDAELQSLYDRYGPDQFSLADRAYIAGIHPLEIVVASYLLNHPGATEVEVQKGTASERQAAYAWLFKTHSRHKQDIRLRILMEEDAFDQIFEDWQRQGYPFGRLVPSLSTAIGSSGDRPDALAKLIGIILDGGVSRATVDFDRLAFAAGTPYETVFEVGHSPPERVMAPEVADTIREALIGVVTNGTADGLRGTYVDADGVPIVVGGKTGTGDNRFDRFTSGGWVTSSRAVDRTATFVFFLGDRFFGTVTAYVSGPKAAHYSFSSELAVQVLKVLEPALMPLLHQAPADQASRAERYVPAIP
jgi:membrane peptidoglycan carboxypeptidase